MKGKRQEGAIDKDLQKLIVDLMLSQKTEHPQYGYLIDTFVNSVSNDVLLDFLRVAFCRLKAVNKPEVLLRFIDELTVGDMDEMKNVFGDDVPLCDWEFWKHMFSKTNRKITLEPLTPINIEDLEDDSNGTKKSEKKEVKKNSK